VRRVKSVSRQTKEETAVAPPRDDRRDKAATTRFCALTRQERPVSELLRFVAGPEDRIFLDLARKLPGRGVWITADRESVDAAVRKGAFSRSLKRKLAVPSDLADQVQSQLARHAIQLLSIANKAGLLVTGFDKVTAVIELGQASILLHGKDAASGGRQKLDSKLNAVCRAAGKAATIIDCFTIDELSLAIGRPNVVHAALKAGGATDRFLESTARLTQYRAGIGTGEASSGAPMPRCRRVGDAAS
jgi:uncharacterized protein